MTIHVDPIELTKQPSLWRVPQVRFGERKIVAQRMPGLGNVRVDLECDEDALVWAWPGEAMYCYRCQVSSNDPNPMLDVVPKYPEPMGIAENGCEHIEAVAHTILQRCQAAARPRRRR